MPNEIIGCPRYDECGYAGPLKLVYAFKSQYTKNKLNTTYECPRCGTPYWDAEPIIPKKELR